MTFDEGKNELQIAIEEKIEQKCHAWFAFRNGRRLNPCGGLSR